MKTKTKGSGKSGHRCLAVDSDNKAKLKTTRKKLTQEAKEWSEDMSVLLKRIYGHKDTKKNLNKECHKLYVDLQRYIYQVYRFGHDEEKAGERSVVRY